MSDPDYLEAFPALDMGEATGAKECTRWVTWFDQSRDAIGRGRVTRTDFTIELLYDFERLDFDLPQSGRRSLRVNPVARGTYSYRFHVICRSCGKYVYRLFYRTSDWLCKQCQHLRNRSTFLSLQLRRQEEYDQLRLQIGEGRPHRMREERYAKMRDRMVELRDKLDGSRRRPGPQFDRVVYAQWSDVEPQR